jgi:hypothetical protein
MDGAAVLYIARLMREPFRIARFLNWFRPRENAGGFCYSALFEDLRPGFQCQAHELYPVFDVLGDIINQSRPTRLA